MNKFLKQIGFLLGLALVVFVGYWLYRVFFTPQGVYITVEGPNHVFGINVPFDITVIIHNNTAQTVTETFNSTCTEPEITINKKEPDLGRRTCGSAMTEVSIRPYATRSYTITVPGDNGVVQFGDNTIQAIWNSNVSIKPGEFTLLVQR